MHWPVAFMFSEYVSCVWLCYVFFCCCYSADVKLIFMMCCGFQVIYVLVSGSGSGYFCDRRSVGQSVLVSDF
jgi:hypothetical protein